MHTIWNVKLQLEVYTTLHEMHDHEISWWREITNWKIDTYFASSYICQNWYDFPNNPSYYINNKSLRRWYTKLPIISSHGNEYYLFTKSIRKY